jgi:hypothetical protein
LPNGHAQRGFAAGAGQQACSAGLQFTSFIAQVQVYANQGFLSQDAIQALTTNGLLAVAGLAG